MFARPQMLTHNPQVHSIIHDPHLRMGGSPTAAVETTLTNLLYTTSARSDLVSCIYTHNFHGMRANEWGVLVDALCLFETPLNSIC